MKASYADDVVIRTLSHPSTWQKAGGVGDLRSRLIIDGMTFGEYKLLQADGLKGNWHALHIQFSEKRGRISLETPSVAVPNFPAVVPTAAAILPDAPTPSADATEAVQLVIDAPKQIEAPETKFVTLGEAAMLFCSNAAKPKAALRKRISRGSITTEMVDGEPMVAV